MTVKELIEELKKYPQDMTVGIMYDVGRSRVTHQPYSEVEIKIAHWEDTNYPYNEEDFDFVNVE